MRGSGAEGKQTESCPAETQRGREGGTEGGREREQRRHRHTLIETERQGLSLSISLPLLLSRSLLFFCLASLSHSVRINRSLPESVKRMWREVPEEDIRDIREGEQRSGEKR